MSENVPGPLKGDPARQAPSLHKGIAFQDWCSVEAWVNLKPGEALYLEGAEDFDIVREGTADTVQTRATAASISLRSDVVVEALLHFWRLQQQHPEKVITFRYLTTSAAVREEGAPFGAETKGLEAWVACSETNDVAVADRLRNFFVDDAIVRAKLEAATSRADGQRPPTLREFFESASPREVLERLVNRIRWDLGSEDNEVVRESVIMRVNAHGRSCGMRPPECAPAIDRLFYFAATTAGQSGDRLLTREMFLREFDDATQRTGLGPGQAKQKSAADLIQEALTEGFDARGMLLQAAALVHREIPEAGERTLGRNGLVEELSERIEKDGMLIFQGSSGMGKSRAARLLAQRIGGEWIWVDFQGVEAEHLPSIMRLFASSLGDESACNVALDNLNFGASDLQAIDVQLAAIVRLTRLHGGKVILTTQRVFGGRTMQRLCATEKNIRELPRLTQEEIEEFCGLLGCPAELAKAHAAVVRLLTSGHPQLVHARLVSLSLRGWPAPKVEDLTATAAAPDEEKEIARQLLDQAPAGDKELLFRLSLVSGAFRRDHAIAIGQIAPALSFPADAFGRLVGPWIETVGKVYFRLSPLLNRAAIENWAADRVRELRGGIVRAFLANPSKTLREMDEILGQGLAAGLDELIGPVVARLAFSAIEEREIISDVLFWLPAIGRRSGRRAAPNHTFTNFLFRIAQFKIAGSKSREEANELCAIIDREYTEDQQNGRPQPLEARDRLIWLTTVLLDFAAIVSPAKLVAYWREALELTPGDNHFRAVAKTLEERTAIIPGMEGASYSSQLLLMVTARSFTPAELVKFAEAVNGLDESYRKIALESLSRMAFPLRLAIDRSWSIEAPKSNPDWAEVIASFEFLQAAVGGWNIPMLDAFIRRAIAAVEDEYRGDSARAMQILSAGTSAQEADRLLKDQRAMVLFRKVDLKGALEIWREIIPSWKVEAGSPDLIPVYACQRAADAAGRLGDWPEVVRMCQFGHEKSLAIGDAHYGTSFLADEALGQWKIGERVKALELLRAALEGFEKLEVDPDHPFLLHFARKVFEQVIKWCRSEVGICEDEAYEPPAGGCSRIDVPEGIENFPAAPFDLMWYYLSDIEAVVHGNRAIFAIAESRIATSKYAAFRAIMSGMVVMERLRTRILARLVPEAVQAVRARVEGKAQVDSGNKVYEADAYPRPKYVDPSTAICQAALGGMMAQALFDRPLDEFLAAWEADAKALTKVPIAVKGLASMCPALAADASEVCGLFGSPSTSEYGRLVAALRMAAERDFSLEEMFVGQIVLYREVIGSILKPELAPILGEFIRRGWRGRLGFAAAFLNPRRTIPVIRDACDSSLSGLSLAAGILLAGNDAVPVTAPFELVEAWRRATEGGDRPGARGPCKPDSSKKQPK